jgi:hypothetical protein
VVPIHDRRDRSIADVVEAPADQGKALRRHIRDRRREVQFALKPWFDHMLVGRGRIRQMADQPCGVKYSEPVRTADRNAC